MSKNMLQGKLDSEVLTREQVVEMDADGKNVLVGELQSRVARVVEKLRQAEELVAHLKAASGSGGGGSATSETRGGRPPHVLADNNGSDGSEAEVKETDARDRKLQC